MLELRTLFFEDLSVGMTEIRRTHKPAETRTSRISY